MSKKLFTLISLAFIFINSAFAQSPQAISYQAIARDATGAELVSQPVGIKISIHTGSATGVVEYSETHSNTTNQFGLFTLEIGNGIPVTGTFATIDWSTGLKFMQVELDPTGGTTYLDMGTSQLLSVPYALAAQKVLTTPDLSLNDLNDVNTSGATNNQLLQWNGTSWVPATINAGDDWGTQVTQTTPVLSGNGTSATPLDLAQQGATNGQVLKWNGTIWTPSNDIGGGTGDNWGTQVVQSDVTLTGQGINGNVLKLAQQGATNGQTLKWNGTTWLPANDNNTTYTGGTGINVAGTIITNAAPDQTVTLTGNGATSVTGTYPNFTITSTDNNTTYSAGSGITFTGTVVSNNAQTDATLSGNATVATPLKIAQQGATSGQVLKWNGSSWAPSNDIGGGAGDNWGTQVVQSDATLTGQGISGNTLKLAQQGATNGQTLKWNGTTWLPATDNNTTYTAGTGINIAGTTITNSSPDQTVTLTGGGATNVTGTYPNFTVTSTDNNTDAQTLSVNANTLTISGGNSVSLPAQTTYTAGTGINISGNVISNTGDVNANDDITNTTSAGGDLNGTYPNPGVAKIRGVTVSATAPTNGQVLKYNGTQWNPAADNNTTYTQGTGINITGTTISNIITALDNLSDVNTTGETSGQVLKFNGTNWVPGTDNTSSSSGGVNVTPRLSGDGTAGTPLDIAQQGATTGQVLQWNGTSWIPTSSAGSFWTANGNNISNTNIGNVGIGTNTPFSKLDVAGNIALNNNTLLLRDGNDANHGLKYDATVDGPYLFGYNGGALGTAGQLNSLTWDYNGNVNVHSTITVDGAGANNGSFNNVLQFGTGSNEGIGSNRSGAGVNLAGLDFYTNSTNRLHITNDGNVTIGITYPVTYNLLTVGSGITVDGSNQNNGTILNTLSFGGSGGTAIGSNRTGLGVNDHGLDFYTGNTKQVSIDIAGDVGIGTATPGAKLDVEGNVKITDGTQGDGKVLTSDASGNAYWKGFVGCMVEGRMDTAINSGASFNIRFPNEKYDDGNGYNPATGIYTVPVSGIYHIHCTAVIEIYSCSTYWYFGLLCKINGSYYVGTGPSNDHSEFQSMDIDFDVKANSGDQISIIFYNDFCNGATFGPGTAYSPWMSIHLVK